MSLSVEQLRSALQSLTSLGRELAGTLAVESAVEHTANTLQHVLTPDQLLIVLEDIETQEPFVAYALQYAKARPNDPLIRAVITEGPRVLSRPTESEVGAVAGSHVDGVGSWVGAPVFARGRAIGAISATARGAGHFDAWHLDVVSAVAGQLGIALENVRLLQLLSVGKLEWEQAVDAISQAFCLVGANGLIRRATRSFAELVGEPLQALAGRPWESLVPQRWVAPLTDLLARAETRPSIEFRSDDRAFTLSALRLEQPAGTVVLVFEDQTEKRRLQDQLIQSEKLSAIGQLIAGVAHDLNNPLASVVGFSDFLIEGANIPADLREPLEAIRNESERAAKIVRSLLSFARKHEGERRVQPIGPIIEATVLLLRNQLMTHHIDVDVDLDGALPLVAVDANQIQQVFVNLLNNAAQAIATSGVGDRLIVRATPWLDGVAVTITDNGPGVPGEIAAQIFEPFFTTKPEGQGTGLGLSICQGLVREHGGRITYERPANGGASFRVDLPGSAATPEDTSSAATSGRALQILVVDDEPHILHYMRAALESWGHTVDVAKDGAEAWSKVCTGSYDVIVSDLRMPTRGGREFYQEVLATQPDMARRIVFSTGDTVRDDTLAFLEAQGRPYLRKPFTLEELRRVLLEALG